MELLFWFQELFDGFFTGFCLLLNAGSRSTRTVGVGLVQFF
jgi:hypothetical protein